MASSNKEMIFRILTLQILLIRNFFKFDFCHIFVVSTDTGQCCFLWPEYGLKNRFQRQRKDFESIIIENFIDRQIVFEFFQIFIFLSFFRCLDIQVIQLTTFNVLGQ